MGIGLVSTLMLIRNCLDVRSGVKARRSQANHLHLPCVGLLAAHRSPTASFRHQTSKVAFFTNSDLLKSSRACPVYRLRPFHFFFTSLLRTANDRSIFLAIDLAGSNRGRTREALDQLSEHNDPNWPSAHRRAPA